MAFITREELPAAYRAAYDKAAKGIENDETRTNGKNDKKIIDSEKELDIFYQEIEYNCKKAPEHNEIVRKIAVAKEQIQTIHKQTEQRIEKEAKKRYDFGEQEAKNKLAKYEEEHPVKTFFHKLVSGFTFGHIEMDSDYEEMWRNAHVGVYVVQFDGRIAEGIKADEQKLLSALW